MKNFLNKTFLILCFLLLADFAKVNAQATALEKKTDTIARLAIRYMNTNLPDSVYALTGENFRSQIPAETWKTVYSTQLTPLMPFTKVEFVSSTNSINTYKLTGAITLTYTVSLDSKNKINIFAFVPYKE